MPSVLTIAHRIRRGDCGIHNIRVYSECLSSKPLNYY